MISATQAHNNTRDVLVSREIFAQFQANGYCEETLSKMIENAVADGHYSVEVMLTDNEKVNHYIVVILKNQGYKVTDCAPNAIEIEW